MNKVKNIVVLLIAEIIQFSILSRIEIFSSHINIFFPIIIALTLGFGVLRGSYSALFLGLCEDLIFSDILGVKALIYFTLAFILGKVNYRFNIKDKKTGALLTGLLTLIVNGILFSIGYFSGLNIGDISLVSIFVIEPILNGLLYLPILAIFRKIYVFPDIIFYR